MTFREAFSELQGILGNYAPENLYPTACRHLKHATMEFARTPATIQTMTVALTGAQDYTLPQARIARVYEVQHDSGGTIYRPTLVAVNEIADNYPDSSTTGAEARFCSIFGRTLRIAPLVSTGTVTLFYSPMPVVALRDTPRNKVETATGGSTSTAAASTITHGLVNNRAGTTDYFTGCRIVFDSGNSASQSSFITTANEGSAAITFTFSPVVSTTIANNDTFHIEDVLEVPEQYVPACIDYAAGMIAALDPTAAILSNLLIQRYTDTLTEAKGKPFGWQPGAKFRIRDYTERSSNALWVS